MFRLFFILFQVLYMTDNRQVAHYSIPEYSAHNAGMYECYGLDAAYI